MDDGTVVGRALEIINTVAMRIQTPLAELAAKTGIPKPTARRIAEDLVRRHVLVRAPNGYVIGPGLEHLGHAAAVQRQFPDAREHLAELHARCGGIAWLGAVGPHDATGPVPVEMVCDAELSAVARSGWPDMADPGTLANTAAGRLVLAHRADLLEKIARAGVPRTTPNSPSTLRQLEGILRQTRDRGASVESEQFMLGWRCVAAQFRGSGGDWVVLGVSAPVARSDPSRMVKAVLGGVTSMESSVAGATPDGGG